MYNECARNRRRIERRAIELVEQKFPALCGRIKPVAKWKPTEVMLDYVDRHFPDARAQMGELPPPSRR